MYNKKNTVKVSRQFREGTTHLDLYIITESSTSNYTRPFPSLPSSETCPLCNLTWKARFRSPGRGLHTHLSARETKDVSIATGSGQARTVSRNKRLSVRPNPPTKDNGKMSSEEVDFLGEKKLEKKTTKPSTI